MKVLGLDPSLSNFGIVLADLNIDTLKFEIEDMLLIETAPGKNKKTVRKNSDDLERARMLTTGLESMVDKASMAFVEVPHGSQSARSMASYGMCIGVLSLIKLPLIQLTASEVKLAATGRKTATKEEMIAWAHSLHPNADWLPGVRTGKNASKNPDFIANKNEHLADATAAIQAGIATDEFKSVLMAIEYMARAEA